MTNYRDWVDLTLSSTSNSVNQPIRKRECCDCAAMNLYMEISLSCRDYATDEEKDIITRHWYCHNGGGSCKGAHDIIYGHAYQTETLP